MVLELHTWGPAFGLPSIDAQCLTTIAYFTLAVPEKDAAWVLIPDSDPLMVPTHELPAVWTGSRWISGFRNIVEFLKQYSSGEWNLDGWMDKQERADCTAFSSFIESHAQPLVDLSLYVSSQNYTAATMPCYSSILRWPNQWIVPPRIRDLAKTRTDHLGLSSLDLDVAEQERKRTRETADKAAAQIPERLTKRPRETVSSLLGKTSHQSLIRLDGMTGAFVAPLNELRGKKRYLLSDELPSSLDCLALGYLSLAIVPELPYSWLRDAVKSQADGLGVYTERLRSRCFGEPVSMSMVFNPETPVHPLPWQAPPRPTLNNVGLWAWEAVMDSIPIVRDVRASRRLQRTGQGLGGKEQEMVTQVAQAQRHNTYISVGAVLSGVGLLAWYMLSSGLISIDMSDAQVEEEEEEEDEDGGSSSEWGEAGAMLGL